MASKKKKLFIALGVVAGLVLAALLIIPFFVDLNTYKPLIIEKAEAALGRKVEIGNISLRLLPRPGATVDGVLIYKEGARDKPEFMAERAEASIELWPLLSKRLEIASAVLVNPKARLSFDKDGQLIFAKELAARQSKDEDSDSGDEGFSVVLGEVSIENGEFALYKPNGFWGFGKKLMLRDFNLSIEDPSLDRVVELELEARVSRSDAKGNAEEGFLLRVNGEAGPFNKPDFDFDAECEIKGFDARLLAPYFKDHDIPLEAGNVDVRLEARGRAWDEVSARGKLTAEVLKPLGEGLELSFEIEADADTLKLKSLHLVLETLHLGTLSPFFGDRKISLVGGTAELDLRISGLAPRDDPLAFKRLESRGRLKLDLLASQGARPFEGTLKYEAAIEGETLELKKLALSSRDGDLEASGRVTSIHSKDPGLKLKVSANGLELSALAFVAGLAGIEGLDPERVSGRADAEADISGTVSGPAIDGEVRLRDASLGTKFFTVPIESPDMTITFKGQQVKVDPLNVRLGKNTILGTMDIGQKKAGGLDVVFDLNMKFFDISDLLSSLPMEDDADGESSELSAEALKAEQEAREAFRKLSLRGRLRAEKARYEMIAMEQVLAEIVMDNGLAHIAPFSFNLYGGTATQVLDLDLARKVPRLAFKASLKSVDIKKFVESGTDYKDLVRGSANVTADLRAEGIDAGAMGKKLRGNIHFDIKDGAVESFSLLEMLQQTGKWVGIEEGIDENTTRFHTFTGDLVVEKEKFTTKNTRIISEDMDAKVKGSMKFSGKLNFKVTTRLSEELTSQLKGGQLTTFFIDDGRATIPAAIKGTIYEPKVTIDTEYVAKKLGKKLLKDKLKKGLGSLFK